MSSETGLDCFLDDQRPCGPSCMAYDQAPENKEFQGKQWANCMLLVNAHRAGKHLVVLTQLADKFVRGVSNSAADAARTQQPPPPIPR